MFAMDGRLRRFRKSHTTYTRAASGVDAQHFVGRLVALMEVPNNPDSAVTMAEVELS